MLRAEARTRLGALELDVSLEVASGECLAIAGPSGAGKSSILRLVAGLLRPDHGVVRLDGETWLDTSTGRDLAPERRRIGYVFQEYALFPHLNAWQNVAYPLTGIPRSERRARAEELLSRFGLERLADARPRTLSGGERQRVALARALARRPDVLLLDEPLSALDARTRAAATRELASALRDTEAPVLLVTHDFTEAAMLGDRVGVIDSGRVVQEGTAGELASTPRTAFVADFVGATVLTGHAEAGEDGLTRVALDGGGSVVSTDRVRGPVAVCVFPWEIAIEPPDLPAGGGSARNRLEAEVLTTTEIGNRVRLGLAAPQPLAAEVTLASTHELAIYEGARVTATWKAAATRLVET